MQKHFQILNYYIIMKIEKFKNNIDDIINKEEKIKHG